MLFRGSAPQPSALQLPVATEPEDVRVGVGTDGVGEREQHKVKGGTRCSCQWRQSLMTCRWGLPVCRAAVGTGTTGGLLRFRLPALCCSALPLSGNAVPEQLHARLLPAARPILGPQVALAGQQTSSYGSCLTVNDSDHKPVFCMLDVVLPAFEQVCRPWWPNTSVECSCLLHAG